MNKVELTGRMAQFPELRHTTRGVPVTTFGVEVERDYTTQDGAKITDNIEVGAWRDLAEFASKRLAKGELITIDARLQMRSWEGKDGRTHRAVEVIASEIRVAVAPAPQVDEGYYGDGYFSDEDGVPF